MTGLVLQPAVDPLTLSRACRGVAARSASLFLRALEAGPHDDMRGDLEPHQQDDEIEKSERGRERSSFRDKLASEIRAATGDRRREPRPGVVHGLQRVHITPWRGYLAQEEPRIRDQMIDDHFAAQLIRVGRAVSLVI